ncbi:MAG: MGMT family protein [Candidatus Dormibacteraceae bacterium]
MSPTGHVAASRRLTHKPPTADRDRRSRITGIIDRIRRIPPGRVQTYGGIDPGAPRLVGHVLATTQQRLPWHRVVRADGSMAKGERQRELLRKEGVALRGDRVDLERSRAW